MRRVLVVGDVIADYYREFFYKKDCPDAPGIPAVELRHTEVRPGGAANVAVNIAALCPVNVQVDLIGLVDDILGRSIKFASQSRVNMDHSITVQESLRKERISIDGKLVARLDNAKPSPSLTAIIIDKIWDYLRQNDPDLIVLSDYAAGFICAESIELLSRWAGKLMVDTKLTDLSVFGGNVMLVKLNWAEWKNICLTDAIPERHCKYMVVTHGSNRAELTICKQIDDVRTVTHNLSVTSHDVSTVDVCGCGDTFLAGMAASFLSNDDPYTALQFANAAAATVVEKPKTSVADYSRTLELLRRENT